VLSRKAVFAGVSLAGALILANQAAAQSLSLNFDPGQGVTELALQLIALITVVALAPSILIMVTSFTRIVVVLSLLRTAIGVQQSPPNTVIVSLALFLTAFVMAPVFETAYRDGVRPLIENQVEFAEAFQKSAEPFRTFMLAQAREKDLALFVEMNQKRLDQGQDQSQGQDQTGTPAPATAETKVPLQVLVPAFIISELRRAFEIGFLLFIPFIVIDMVVASILMSMGMLMLPPIIISLPFKLIFFVLVDGWNMITGSLVQSFGT